MEESQFYEKIKKNAEDSIINSSHKFSQGFHENMEEIYKNKSLFFNKYIKSKAKDRYKYPSLGKGFPLHITFLIFFKDMINKILVFFVPFYKHMMFH